MSGIIPPSILTMQYAVDSNFKRYVNLSFPFRVKIEQIWFTADDALSGAEYNNDGGYNPWDLDRVLRLGAVRTRNAANNSEAPSDLNLTWSDYNWYGSPTDMGVNDKPSIWFGLPDDRDNVEDNDPNTPEQVVQYDDWNSTENVYRSTARSLPSVDKMAYWFNYAWDEAAFNAKKYKTDLSVLNTDEVLSLFLYPDGGDWGDYSDNDPGIATIFVQYTGIGGSNDSAPTRIWD